MKLVLCLDLSINEEPSSIDCEEEGCHSGGAGKEAHRFSDTFTAVLLHLKRTRYNPHAIHNKPINVKSMIWVHSSISDDPSSMGCKGEARS